MDRDLNIWTYSDVGEAPFDGDLATYDAVLAELAADPVELILPERQKLPIVISSPHSGDIYPPSFIENAVLDERTLRKSEDCHVHQIAGAAASADVPILSARFPRAFVDPNREAYELDPTMFRGRAPSHIKVGSARARGGLGTIARIVADGQPIYRDRLHYNEAEWRIHTFYRAYHSTLEELLAATRRQFGYAILIDCHSMPSSAIARQKALEGHAADIVLGDRFGRACRRPIIREVEKCFADAGFDVGRNAPYAGGYITEHYGRPNRGQHAVQIEINRALYMNERTLEPFPLLDTLGQVLTMIVDRLGELSPEELMGL
ncbi:MAG: N-formylglutamate amidohydrolase [Alphaproteobacteria bacterium]